MLEQCDEILLTKILDCDGKTSNAMKYLELGAVPVRFEIIKRKLGFLQYILKQDKKSMISQVLNPIIPGVLKTNEIPGGGSRSPPYENDEGVILEPYSQKTFWKGNKFRIV